jgi:hypothetical protein
MKFVQQAIDSIKMGMDHADIKRVFELTDAQMKAHITEASGKKKAVKKAVKK